MGADFVVEGIWVKYECNNKQDYYDYDYYKPSSFSGMTFGTESDKPGEDY